MIRAATEADVEAIVRLCGQLGYEAAAADVAGRLRGLRARGDGEVLVADAEGRAVGWVHVHGVHVLESPGRAEIGGLVVEEAERGRGWGRALMQAAEDWAVRAGYDAVRLRTNIVRAEAHRFYEALGYGVTKQQKVYEKRVRPV